MPKDTIKQNMYDKHWVMSERLVLHNIYFVLNIMCGKKNEHAYFNEMIREMKYNRYLIIFFLSAEYRKYSMAGVTIHFYLWPWNVREPRTKRCSILAVLLVYFLMLKATDLHEYKINDFLSKEDIDIEFNNRNHDFFIL